MLLMGGIGLLYFSEENENDAINNWIKRILYKLKRFFSTKLSEKSIMKISAGEGLDVFFIKLPYTLNEIKNSKHIAQRKIQSILSKACKENSIEKCILPRCTPANLSLKECILNPFSGDFIYKALIINVLEQISQKKKVNIRDFDLAIIHGSNHDMLNYIIEILSPLVKYVTIITKEKEVAEKKTEKILDDTGLAVRITEDFNSGAVDADLLINLEDACNLPSEIRTVHVPVVVNFGKGVPEGFFIGSIVINGIKAVLDNKIRSILKDEVYEYYSSTELAEIFIMHKLKLELNIFTNNTDYSIMAKLSKKFVQDGYSIEDVFS